MTGPGDPRAQLPGGRVRADRPDRHATRRSVEEVTQARERAFGEVRPGARRRRRRATRAHAQRRALLAAALDTIPQAPRGGRRRACSSAARRAQEYDLRESATRDNWLIIPLTLLVVFVILVVLLRALVAPLLLIASVILSFAAALGAGVLVSDYVFGFIGFGPDAAAAARSCSSSRWGSTTTSS